MSITDDETNRFRELETVGCLKLPLRFRFLPSGSEQFVWKPSQVETYLESLGPNPSVPSSQVAFYMGSNETRDLTYEEIEAEYQEWIETRSRAFDPETGSWTWITKISGDNLTMTVMSWHASFIKGHKGYKSKKTVDYMRHKFMSGNLVLEDGPRDPGGLGMIMVRKALTIAKMIEFGQISIDPNSGFDPSTITKSLADL